MPEIAEVETVRRVLKRNILNKKIVHINIIYDRMIESSLLDFKKNILNQSIIDIKRIGKWLIFELENHYLLSHLRMEGKYFLKTSGEPIEKHEHIVFTFADNTDLRYHDTRKFGRMILANKDELFELECIKKQGKEPLTEDLTMDYLINKVNKKKLPIKSILLDQTIISGLGNIYADEVLFAAKINPLKKGESITNQEGCKIIAASNEVIKKAIEMGGTTIKSYTSSIGVSGRFQQYLQVHKRENLACYACGSPIKRIKIGGRSTYYCEQCQK